MELGERVLLEASLALDPEEVARDRADAEAFARGYGLQRAWLVSGSRMSFRDWLEAQQRSGAGDDEIAGEADAEAGGDE